MLGPAIPWGEQHLDKTPIEHISIARKKPSILLLLQFYFPPHIGMIFSNRAFSVSESMVNPGNGCPWASSPCPQEPGQPTLKEPSAPTLRVGEGDFLKPRRGGSAMRQAHSLPWNRTGNNPFGKLYGPVTLQLLIPLGHAIPHLKIGSRNISDVYGERS